MTKFTRALLAAGAVAILAAVPVSANVTGVIFTTEQNPAGKTTYDIETGPSAVGGRDVSGTATDLRSDGRCVRVRTRAQNDSTTTPFSNRALVCGQGRSKSWSTTYVTVKKRITVELCSVNSSGLDAKACRFISG